MKRTRRSGQWFDSALYGPVALSAGWVPPLRYALRRDRVLALLQRLGPADVIEVGCGAGALLDELSRNGFRAKGLETSARARRVAASLAGDTGGSQQIVGVADPTWRGSADIVMAFDVLEHIEDDTAELGRWLDWLRPGGHVLISVPAHRRRWGAGDEWAGHHRRYDRSDVMRLVEQNGLRIEHMECYGFPLANLTEILGQRTYRRLIRERSPSLSLADASADSGVEREDYGRLFSLMDSPPGRVLFRIALAAQRMCKSTDWGSGFLLVARRK